MSVSHPNCITTYKLSVVRLLKSGDALPMERTWSDPTQSRSSQPRAGATQQTGADAASRRTSSEAALSGLAQSQLEPQTQQLQPAPSQLPPLPQQRRRLRSLLSGAEAEEVADPYGRQPPGLYETWIVSEARELPVHNLCSITSSANHHQLSLDPTHPCTRCPPPQYCERGTLGDAMVERKLQLPDGRPNMLSILLSLLDVASGMQYLHNLGITHSGEWGVDGAQKGRTASPAHVTTPFAVARLLLPQTSSPPTCC